MKKPNTMMTLVKEDAVLRRSAGAFSVTYRGGVAVERPTDSPSMSFETKSTGRLGAKTKANEDAIDSVTAVHNKGLLPHTSAN